MLALKILTLICFFLMLACVMSYIHDKLFNPNPELNNGKFDLILGEGWRFTSAVYSVLLFVITVTFCGIVPYVL